VVASVDHTYEATAVKFPDGRFVKSLVGSYFDNSWRTDDQSVSLALSVRLDDLEFVLNELERPNASPDKPTGARRLWLLVAAQPSYRDIHLFVDLLQQVVTVDGETATLTRMQYRPLAVLVEHAGVVVTRPILLLHIRGNLPGLRPSKLDAHVRELRKRLGIYAGQ
jgi:DNA-binding response OmpR family regulator